MAQTSSLRMLQDRVGISRLATVFPYPVNEDTNYRNVCIRGSQFLGCGCERSESGFDVVVCNYRIASFEKAAGAFARIFPIGSNRNQCAHV